MAQLNIFNGGLSTRLSPFLINVNEALVLTNIDITSGNLKPLKTDKDENTTVGNSMIFFKNQWIYSDKDLDYVIFQERLYKSGFGVPQKSIDGINWFNLGIVSPGRAWIIDRTPGVIVGTYAYCLTYYNSVDGSESAPSEYTPFFEMSNERVSLSVTASVDPQVTNIKIYRIGGTLTSMSLVATIPNQTGLYVDNVLDVDIPGDILISQNGGQAPSGLKYLTSANAMFFGAFRDKLYFTDVAYVNNWSPYYFIDFDEPITGIGATANGLLVFTEYTTHIITGTSPTSLSKYLLSTNQGCLLHKSIKFLSNTLVWLSHDGICASTGTDVQVITRSKLGKLKFYTPKASAVYDDVYYLSHSDGIFVVDFRFNAIMYNITADSLIDCFHVTNNTLYYGALNKLYSMFNGTKNREIKYRSPKLGEGSVATRKVYKLVKVYSDSDMTITIYIDDKRAISKNLSVGLNEIYLPTAISEGYHISFEVSGYSELFEINYNVQGTQNGN